MLGQIVYPLVLKRIYCALLLRGGLLVPFSLSQHNLSGYTNYLQPCRLFMIYQYSKHLTIIKDSLIGQIVPREPEMTPCPKLLLDAASCAFCACRELFIPTLILLVLVSRALCMWAFSVLKSQIRIHPVTLLDMIASSPYITVMSSWCWGVVYLVYSNSQNTNKVYLYQTP